ncbi:hypothetical protein HOY82DRAFT_652466 [Tuber indicum]|nr:hypothetical protein HOY82DRAFT_652466 [Tuber indicum]
MTWTGIISLLSHRGLPPTSPAPASPTPAPSSNTPRDAENPEQTGETPADMMKNSCTIISPPDSFVCTTYRISGTFSAANGKAMAPVGTLISLVAPSSNPNFKKRCVLCDRSGVLEYSTGMIRRKSWEFVPSTGRAFASGFGHEKSMSPTLSSQPPPPPSRSPANMPNPYTGTSRSTQGDTSISLSRSKADFKFAQGQPTNGY